MEIIDKTKKHFPSADTWMWDYCTFLGQYTNKNGDNFDLGILLETKENHINEFSFAIVYGNRPGSYISGQYQSNRENADFILETVKRARVLKLIK